MSKTSGPGEHSHTADNDPKVSEPHSSDILGLAAAFTEDATALFMGLALGDALGWPTEFLKMSEIKRRYGTSGIQEPPSNCQFTDDTQMTIAVARAIVAFPNGPLEDLMKVASKEFVDWLKSPDNNRAPGNTCLKGARQLSNGISWQESGDRDRKGCGSAMRVAPIGFVYQSQPELLRDVATATSIATHAHPTAVESAVAAAYLVKLALDKTPLDQWIDRTIEFLGNPSGELSIKLNYVRTALLNENEIEAMDSLGQGWVADEAVALALYCVMKYPDSWVKTVQRGANSNGDSDSIACIAGGIQGARLGLSAIPTEWQNRVEARQEILDLAKQLAMAKSEVK